MENQFESFYEDIKFWTLNDFCTPNIKAEVIFDMLLSPYIADIVKSGLLNENSELVLLAKEFPIKIRANNKGPKIDYLLWNGDTQLYIVELKTDNESFDLTQYERYLDIKDKKNGIGDVFSNIIKKNTRGKVYKNFHQITDVKESNKYVKTFYQILSLLKYNKKFKIEKKEPSPDKTDRAFKMWANNTADNIAAFLNKMDIKIIYVTIEKLPEEVILGKALTNIPLRELCLYKGDDEKKKKWDLVKDIIDDTYTEGTFSTLWRKNKNA